MRVSRGSEYAIVKRVQSERERDLAESLAKIVDPTNHTIALSNELPLGGYYIAMRDGGSPINCIAESDLRSVAMQLVEGLAFMHGQNIAHLDVKPENVLWLEGRVSLIDFGLSERLDDGAELDNMVVGTEGYMAPEVENGKRFDPIRADIWSCGKTMKVVALPLPPSPDRDLVMAVAHWCMEWDPSRRVDLGTALRCLGEGGISSMSRPKQIPCAVD